MQLENVHEEGNNKIY